MEGFGQIIQIYGIAESIMLADIGETTSEHWNVVKFDNIENHLPEVTFLNIEESRRESSCQRLRSALKTPNPTRPL